MGSIRGRFKFSLDLSIRIFPPAPYTLTVTFVLKTARSHRHLPTMSFESRTKS